VSAQATYKRCGGLTPHISDQCPLPPDCEYAYYGNKRHGRPACRRLKRDLKVDRFTPFSLRKNRPQHTKKKVEKEGRKEQGTLKTTERNRKRGEKKGREKEEKQQEGLNESSHTHPFEVTKGRTLRLFSYSIVVPAMMDSRRVVNHST